MEIRRANYSDIPELKRLLLQVGEVHHVLRPDIFRSGALKYHDEALTALLKDENKPIWAAMDGDVMLGYCFCQWRVYQDSSVSTDRTELYIDDLCVDGENRGHGVASALYRHVTAIAKERGCNFITLNVWCGNDSAMVFYEKMGLRPRNIMMEMPLEDETC